MREAEENFLQCHLVHHKSHMKSPGKRQCCANELYLMKITKLSKLFSLGKLVRKFLVEVPVICYPHRNKK
jgi:hypothetical protein